MAEHLGTVSCALGLSLLIKPSLKQLSSELRRTMARATNRGGFFPWDNPSVHAWTCTSERAPTSDDCSTKLTALPREAMEMSVLLAFAVVLQVSSVFASASGDGRKYYTKGVFM